MTLEEKAIEFIREIKGKSKEDRPNEQIKIFYEEELKLLIGFATKVTKEFEKENKRLEQQIEKMKNNWNCKDIGNCIYSRCPCEHWELKE